MRRSRVFLGTHALVRGLAALALDGCDTLTVASGRVVDEVGRPVRGAVVTARKGGQRVSTRTDMAGRFATEFTGVLRSPDAVVAACRPGVALQAVRVPDGAQERDLTLRLLPTRTVPAQTGRRAGTRPCS